MAFKMKSGNDTSFKMMGSSPMNKRVVTKTTDAEGNTTKTVTKTGISKPRSKFTNMAWERRDKKLYDAEGNKTNRKDFVKKIKTKTKDASGKRTSKSVSKVVSSGTSMHAAGTKYRQGYHGTDWQKGSTRTVKGKGLKAKVTKRHGEMDEGISYTRGGFKQDTGKKRTATRGQHIKEGIKTAGKTVQAIANIPGDIARGVIGEVKRNNAAQKAKGDAKRASK